MSFPTIGTDTTQNSLLTPPDTNKINSNPQGSQVANNTSFVNEQLKTKLTSVAEGMTNNHINFEKAHSVSLRHNTSIDQGFWGKIKQVFRNIIHSLRSLSRNPDQAIRTLHEQCNAIEHLYQTIYDQCIRNPDDTMTFNRFNELFDRNKAPNGIGKEITEASYNIRQACYALQEEANHFKTATKDQILQEVNRLLNNLDHLNSFRIACESFSTTANDLPHLSEYHGLNDHKNDSEFFRNTFLKDLRAFLDKRQIPPPSEETSQVS